MSKMSELNAKAEVIMMGNYQPVASAEEVKILIDYFIQTLKNTGILAKNSTVTGESIYESAFQYSDKEKTTVQGLCLNSCGDMLLLTLTMKTPEDKVFDVLSRDGAFGYVYNFTYPDCSELGYSFFKKQPSGFIKRVA